MIRLALYLLVLLWPIMAAVAAPAFGATDGDEYRQSIALTDAERAWIEAHPAITLGTDRDWRPYVLVDAKGGLSGIEPDLIARINQLTGLDMRLVVGE